MFLPYVVEDNIEKKTELDVVLNESLNTINKGNRKVLNSYCRKITIIITDS
jgi:hypothetical protein